MYDDKSFDTLKSVMINCLLSVLKCKMVMN
jgi:hypothetical protein